jgi:hypothetical protein
MDSLDFPVARIVVVVQGQHRSALDQAAALEAQARENVTVVYQPIQLGCAGGWNEAIRLAPSAPYWLLANNDVAFFPGQLRAVAEALARRYSTNSKAFTWKLFGATCFAVTAPLVKAVGLFDENIFPAYYEDNDFFGARLHAYCRRAGLDRGAVLIDETALGRPAGLVFRHGEQLTNESYVSGTALARRRGAEPRGPTLSFASLAARSSTSLYFRRKWRAAAHLYAHPFDNPALEFDRPYFDADMRRCTLAADPLLPARGEACYHDATSAPAAAAPSPLAPRFVYVDAGARLGDTLHAFEKSEAFRCHPAGWHVVAFDPAPPLARVGAALAAALNAGASLAEARARVGWGASTEECVRGVRQGNRTFDECAAGVARWERAHTAPPHAAPPRAEVRAALGAASAGWCGDRNRYFFVPAGVSTREATRNVSWHAGRYLGGAAGGAATLPGSVFTGCKLVDLVGWLDATWHHRDYVYLKLDVGGAEYRVLRALFATGVLDKVDELEVTWHHQAAPTGRTRGGVRAVADALRKRVAELGIVLHERTTLRDEMEDYP